MTLSCPGRAGLIPVGPQPLATRARPLGALGFWGRAVGRLWAVDYGDERANVMVNQRLTPSGMSLGNPDRAISMCRALPPCARIHALAARVSMAIKFDSGRFSAAT